MPNAPQSTPKKPERPRFGIFGWLSLTLFLASLAFTPYYTDRPDDAGKWQPSLGLLLFGWLGIGSGGTSWLANPALLCSWILLPSRRLHSFALLSASISLCFAISFLFQATIMVDEAGHDAAITSRGPGYWLWIASILAALAASIKFLPHKRTP